MAEQFTSLVNSVGGLSIANKTTEILAGSISNCRNPTQQALVEAIQTLIQSCEDASKQAQQAEALVRSTQSRSDRFMMKLRKRATALTRITETLRDATERHIIAYISSLAGPGSLVQKMLQHFTHELRNIVRNVLDSTSDDGNVLRETLEMSYDQALHTSGTLHSDNYFIPLGEASLGWPYDPDFESEAYYQHEDRLALDEGYAEAFRVRCEHRYEKEKQKEKQQTEEWIGFWVQALSSCPDGPTLFYSPAGRLPNCHLADVPRYLFRAFDRDSYGRSDHRIVASAASISPGHSTVNLLSRTEEEIKRMLYTHLTYAHFGEGDANNLVSWSSSLLFVIQCAIWRCHGSDGDPTGVEICMIDTRKFPRGQFARDKPLLRAYPQAPEVDKKKRSISNLRLNGGDYDNGEYLSQGVLHHAGRSSVVSLAQLIQAGLHDLYPEFADRDNAARSLWPKRVGALRSKWAPEHTTTQLEIQRALKIARSCFNSFDAPDVATLLLSFKERKLRASATKGAKFCLRRSSDYGPYEVQRYMAIAETMMPKDRDRDSLKAGGQSTTSDSQLLEGVFECS
ncbi:hypothetical protein FQN54_009477 [Arachnomyces sp. PD_36]|nr:hypothetical protein FQN54_009477 [Arachnomyces sp. PD_36]